MLSGISRGGVVSRARGLSFMYRYEWFPSLVQALVPLFFFASLAQAWSLRFTAARERKQERSAPDQSSIPWILLSIAGRVVVVLVSYRTLAWPLRKRGAVVRSLLHRVTSACSFRPITAVANARLSGARGTPQTRQPPPRCRERTPPQPCPQKASTRPQGKP